MRKVDIITNLTGHVSFLFYKNYEIFNIRMKITVQLDAYFSNCSRLTLNTRINFFLWFTAMVCYLYHDF
jgi:hypothetical protein